MNLESFHLLKSQFPKDFEATDNITPALYYPQDLYKYLSIVDAVREHEPDKIDGLFFTGKKWKGRRRILRALSNIIVSCDKLPLVDFTKKMKEYKVILSLPAHGNLCHREFEAFGIGVPVLMPEHTNKLYDPLIPNEHYVSVSHWTELEERYNEVKDDKEFLEYISKNAMEWFDRNCRYPNCYKYFKEPLSKILKV